MRVLPFVSLLVLTPAASGCDDDDGGNASEFCAKAVEIGSGDAGAAEANRIADELADIAPEEIEDDVDVLRDVSEESSPEDVQRVAEAATAVNEYLVRECSGVVTSQ